MNFDTSPKALAAASGLDGRIPMQVWGLIAQYLCCFQDIKIQIDWLEERNESKLFRWLGTNTHGIQIGPSQFEIGLTARAGFGMTINSHLQSWKGHGQTLHNRYLKWLTKTIRKEWTHQQDVRHTKKPIKMYAGPKWSVNRPNALLLTYREQHAFEDVEVPNYPPTDPSFVHDRDRQWTERVWVASQFHQRFYQESKDTKKSKNAKKSKDAKKNAVVLVRNRIYLDGADLCVVYDSERLQTELELLDSFSSSLIFCT